MAAREVHQALPQEVPDRRDVAQLDGLLEGLARFLEGPHRLSAGRRRRRRRRQVRQPAGLGVQDVLDLALPRPGPGLVRALEPGLAVVHLVQGQPRRPQHLAHVRGVAQVDRDLQPALLRRRAGRPRAEERAGPPVVIREEGEQRPEVRRVRLVFHALFHAVRPGRRRREVPPVPARRVRRTRRPPPLRVLLRLPPRRGQVLGLQQPRQRPHPAGAGAGRGLRRVWCRGSAGGLCQPRRGLPQGSREEPRAGPRRRGGHAPRLGEAFTGLYSLLFS